MGIEDDLDEDFDGDDSSLYDIDVNYQMEQMKFDKQMKMEQIKLEQKKFEKELAMENLKMEQKKMQLEMAKLTVNRRPGHQANPQPELEASFDSEGDHELEMERLKLQQKRRNSRWQSLPALLMSKTKS